MTDSALGTSSLARLRGLVFPPIALFFTPLQTCHPPQTIRLLSRWKDWNEVFFPKRNGDLPKDAAVSVGLPPKYSGHLRHAHVHEELIRNRTGDGGGDGVVDRLIDGGGQGRDRRGGQEQAVSTTSHEILKPAGRTHPRLTAWSLETGSSSSWRHSDSPRTQRFPTFRPFRRDASLRIRLARSSILSVK